MAHSSQCMHPSKVRIKFCGWPCHVIHPVVMCTNDLICDQTSGDVDKMDICCEGSCQNVTRAKCHSLVAFALRKRQWHLKITVLLLVTSVPLCMQRIIYHVQSQWQLWTRVYCNAVQPCEVWLGTYGRQTLGILILLEPHIYIPDLQSSILWGSCNSFWVLKVHTNCTYLQVILEHFRIVIHNPGTTARESKLTRVKATVMISPLWPFKSITFGEPLYSPRLYCSSHIFASAVKVATDTNLPLCDKAMSWFLNELGSNEERTVPYNINSSLKGTSQKITGVRPPTGSYTFNTTNSSYRNSLE